MSTINELLEQLRTVKEEIRAAINTAYGEEVVSTDECLDAYAEYISGLCPCPTHCIKFIYGEGEEYGYGGTIEICGIEDGGCLTLDKVPGKPSFPEMDNFHWVFMGWSIDGTLSGIVTKDICNVIEDMTYYAVYIKEWHFVFYESDGATVIKEGYILDQNQLTSDMVPTPTIPSGYTFSGWQMVTDSGVSVPSFPHTMWCDTYFTAIIKPIPSEVYYEVSTDYDSSKANVTVN